MPHRTVRLASGRGPGVNSALELNTKRRAKLLTLPAANQRARFGSSTGCRRQQCLWIYIRVLDLRGGFCRASGNAAAKGTRDRGPVKEGRRLQYCNVSSSGCAVLCRSTSCWGQRRIVALEPDVRTMARGQCLGVPQA